MSKAALVSMIILLFLPMKACSPLSTQAAKPSNITCTIYQANITLGDPITVSGVISPIRVGVTVSLDYAKPDGLHVIVETVTSLTGSYKHTYLPDMTGPWNVTASWDGDAEYEEAVSLPAFFTVAGLSPEQSSITCITDSSAIVIGSSVKISGRINPAKLVQVTIENSVDGADLWETLASVASDPEGRYSYQWTPDASGLHLLRASWPGDNDYAGATSEYLYLTVHKIASSISCSVSSETVKVGEEVGISGSISPVPNKTIVILSYEKPDGTVLNRTVSSTVHGTFSDVFTPISLGRWSVSASWQGNSYCEGATSTAASFNVESTFPYSFLIAGIVATIVALATLIVVIRKRSQKAS